MRRAAGFTLYEVMVVTAVLGLVISTAAGLAYGLQRSDRFTAAYVSDVNGLRRAVRLVESDLRRARALDELDYALEGSDLKRRGRIVARNIARFEVEREGRLVTVTIALGARADVPPSRRPAVTTRVYLRNAEAGR